jgi:hypothetical protein
MTLLHPEIGEIVIALGRSARRRQTTRGSPVKIGQPVRILVVREVFA